jgi:predicted ATPase/DNA-binding SARP family transcriptional activator/Tfp pilus assembly protein PilF
MAAGAYVQLLGQPGVRVEGKLIDFLPNKRFQFLAYLAYQNDWVSRDKLAFLFWPDETDHAARHNLRQLLKYIRKMDWLSGLEADKQRLRWQVKTDVTLVKQALEEGKVDTTFRLYQGPLLPGIEGDGEGEFGEWLVMEREGFHGRWREGLLSYAEELDESGSHGGATLLLLELLERDPLDEEGLQAYMRSAARAGHQKQALSAYRAFAKRLQTELEMQPSSATEQLAKEIEDAPSLPSPRRVANVPAEPSPVIDRSVAVVTVTGVIPSLPKPATSFVGRDLELPEVVRLLSQEECLLLTLTGAGGVGKTRLALQAVQELGKNYPDGVYFVPLDSLTSAGSIPTTLAATLGIKLQGLEEPLTQIGRFLKSKRILLLLDNYEHLLEGAIITSELLQTCPELTLLVTSRERLNLEEEWLLHVQGLSYPADISSLEKASAHDAVQLFVRRAQRVQPSFTLTEEELPYVLQICSLVQGFPLGIELAAAWVRAMPVAAIAREIGRNYDFLSSTSRNLTDRHRSIRATFEHSWKLLTPEEAAALKRLSVFQGGFTREAVEEVVGATIPVLARLVDKSLLEVTVKGRYVQHPLLHQYAREKLEAANELRETQQSHAAFFLELAETAEPHLTGPQQALWLNRLEDEYDNLRAALTWSTEGDITISLRLGTALWRFWVVRGYMREGQELLEKLLAHPEAQSRSKARAAALNGLGTLIFETGDFVSSKPVLEEALSILRELGERREIATTLNHLGWITTQLSEIHASEAFNEEALNLNKQLQNPRGVAVALNNLGWLAMYQGDFTKARDLFRESLELRHELGDERGLAYAQANLAWAEWRIARFTEADGLLEKALGKLRKLDDHQLVAWTLHQKGCLALARDHLEEAEKHARESARLWHKSSNREGLALTLTTLADIVRFQGKLEESATLLAEAQRIWQSLSGYKWAIACTLLSQAQLVLAGGDTYQAGVLIEKSLRIRREISDRHGMVECWEALAQLRVFGSPEQAVWLFAAAQRLRERIEAPLSPRNQGNHERSIATLRTALGEKVFAEAWLMGQGMKPIELV